MDYQIERTPRPKSRRRRPEVSATPGRLLAAALAAGILASLQNAALAEPTPVERGRHLVTIGGCNDCHTPKILTAAGPSLDTRRLLSGHPADEKPPPVPAGIGNPGGWGIAVNSHLTAWSGPWGISFAANLTPDESGLGSWTEEAFMQAVRSGKHKGSGRPILPPMPWFNYATLSDDDLRALFAYLRTLPPIRNQVPEPLPPRPNANARP